MAMAEGRSVAKGTKPRRKKKNPVSSPSFSSSSSSSLSPHFDVEIESIIPGKHDTKQKLMGAPASAATKSCSGGRKGEDLIYVSPSRVRFQHSRIRPQFSGCGRSVVETLDQIRQGKFEPGDLPPIQVIIGTEDTQHNGESGEEPWYYSLNNRRLWVLKQCHREGLLDNERYNNKIGVRARVARSQAEKLRYTVNNCALEAKFMREDSGKNGSKQKKKGKGKKTMECTNIDGLSTIEPCEFSHRRTEHDEEIESYDTSVDNDDGNNESERADDDDDDDEDDKFVSYTNPFSALS